MSSAGWLAARAAFSLSTCAARSISARRVSITERSGGADAAAEMTGADFTASMSLASFSERARTPAISLRNAAIDFSNASNRDATAASAVTAPHHANSKSPPDEDSPAFSPDGSTLAFLSDIDASIG